MGLIFGDAESLHKHLLKFTARSGKPVTVNGEAYTVEHSQFGTYDIQDAFVAVVTETDSDPRYDNEFTNELEDALEHTTACITDHDLTYHFDKREYFEPSDLSRAATDYQSFHHMMENGHFPTRSARPRAKSREEAIADLFSLMHASEAGMDALLPFNTTGALNKSDNDDDEKPDEGLNHDEIAYALQDTVSQLHGPSALRQPDPSLHTTRVLYEIYDEIGMRPKVRQVYGIFVNPTRPGCYEPDDASGRYMNNLTGDLMASMMGGSGNTSERWTSVNEPPLESLESYEPRG